MSVSDVLVFIDGNWTNWIATWTMTRMRVYREKTVELERKHEQAVTVPKDMIC